MREREGLGEGQGIREGGETQGNRVREGERETKELEPLPCLPTCPGEGREAGER